MERARKVAATVSRIERSEIRDRPINEAVPPPDVAWAQPGYEPL